MKLLKENFFHCLKNYKIKTMFLFYTFRVHYRDKETIGTRLTASGLEQAYKLPTKYRGPMPTKVSLTTSALTITYDKGETPLYVRSTRGFEVLLIPYLFSVNRIEIMHHPSYFSFVFSVVLPSSRFTSHM